jgi:hypothetical protein
MEFLAQNTDAEHAGCVRKDCFSNRYLVTGNIEFNLLNTCKLTDWLCKDREVANREAPQAWKRDLVKRGIKIDGSIQ